MERAGSAQGTLRYRTARQVNEYRRFDDREQQTYVFDCRACSPLTDRPARASRVRGLGLDALGFKKLLQLALLVHFAHDVAAAHELALDVKLWNGRPIGEGLDTLAQAH